MKLKHMTISPNVNNNDYSVQNEKFKSQSEPNAQSQPKTYQCDDCPNGYRNWKEISSHMKLKHMTIVPNENNHGYSIQNENQGEYILFGTHEPYIWNPNSHFLGGQFKRRQQNYRYNNPNFRNYRPNPKFQRHQNHQPQKSYKPRHQRFQEERYQKFPHQNLPD